MSEFAHDTAPTDEPDSIEIRSLAKRNILTATAEYERLARATSEPQKRTIAVAWLFHLVGDVHQPFHYLITTRTTEGFAALMSDGKS